MENQNPNQTNGQSDELSNLKKMFSDYQKKQEQTQKKSHEEQLAKYFVPRKTIERFRILPPKNNRKPIEEAFFHVVSMNAAGGKKVHGKVIYCPAHNDPKVKKIGVDGKPVLDSNNNPVLVPAPCPLCAKHKNWLAKQDPSLKGIKKENMTDEQLIIKAKNDEIYKEAIKWEAKKFYIVRGIDKGAEKDGVKFWRFKHHFKNQGTLDKLLPILEYFINSNQTNFTDPLNGTDLNITMVKDKLPNGTIYNAVSSIIACGKSPLHADPMVAKGWLDDEITWREVFQPKKAPFTTPYEFLEMIAKGVNPYWEDTDTTKKHWVFPGNPELEAKANTRALNLDKEEANYEQASDLNGDYTPTTEKVNMKTTPSAENIVNTSSSVENKVNIAPLVSNLLDLSDDPDEPDESNDADTASSNKWDDLPF